MHETLINRFVTMVNNHDLTDIGDVVTDDITEDGPIVVDAPTGGLAAFHAGWTQMLTSFPDIHVTVTDMIEDEHRVAARISLRATGTGPYRRAGATGRHAEWTGVLWLRIREGRICHFGGLTDRFAVLQQLGFIGDDDQLATN
jgi:predicted ester cyclase